MTHDATDRDAQDTLSRNHALAPKRLHDQVERLAAEDGHTELPAAVTTTVRQDLLADIWYAGRPQPLGICLYPSASAKDPGGREVHNELTADRDRDRTGKPYTVVYSRYYRLGTREHPTPDGLCSHELYVDDGSIYTVEPDPVEGYLVKTGRAECLNSVPELSKDGTWWSVDTWRLPCAAGKWTTETTWKPAAKRYTPESTEKNRAPEDMALNEARPVGRADLQKFAITGNYRNVTESHNAWYKRSLPHHGRAATLGQRSQEFDFLAGACLANAITWARSLE